LRRRAVEEEVVDVVVVVVVVPVVVVEENRGPRVRRLEAVRARFCSRLCRNEMVSMRCEARGLSNWG
jgi:hypothetical protein